MMESIWLTAVSLLVIAMFGLDEKRGGLLTLRSAAPQGGENYKESYSGLSERNSVEFNSAVLAQVVVTHAELSNKKSTEVLRDIIR